MSKFLNYHKKGATKQLYKAILDIHYERYDTAAVHISQAQVEIYEELQSRTGYNDFSSRNYANAIKTLAKAEMLVELKEVIRYKQSGHQPEFQRAMRNRWQTRLKLSHQNVNSFFKRMMTWTLAAPPYLMQDGWLHLAKMANDKGWKSGRAIL